MIKIIVPATSANIGSGFDALGLALDYYNEVYMEVADEISIKTLDNTKIPTDENNLIYISAKRLYDECGKKMPGMRIEQINRIPIARGLGSSSACIIAGLVGANRFLGNPLSQEEMINLAANIEGHPDNTTPALTGGLVTSAMEAGKVYSVTVPIADTIRFAVMIPPFELKTELSRGALPDNYSKTDAVFNLSRSALMVASLFSGNFNNLRVAVSDRLHQPYRLKFIPGIDVVFRLSYELGSFGTYISGAGPTIISIVNDDRSDMFRNHMIKKLEKKGQKGWQLKILKPASHGAKIEI